LRSITTIATATPSAAASNTWSAKAEYQYYDFGDSRFVAPAALVPFGSFHNDDHTIKAGINYRFNLGSPAVARY
jgi:outer membrane immunogenic protein